MVIFNFEEKKLKKEINERGAKRILIQLPEGLKSEGPRLAAVIEETGALAIISADSCYGACDLALFEAENLDIDLIVHYGHSEMIKQKQVPTVYIEARADIDISSTIKQAIPLLKDWQSIGLVTTIQHIHKLRDAKERLQVAEKYVVMGKSDDTMKHVGQVTGCNYRSATLISTEVEAYLLLGGGKFHAIGLALTTTKPVIVADPFEERAYSIKNEVQRIYKQRWASIYNSMKVEKVGVLIGLKSGQNKIKEALKIKEQLEQVGKNVSLLALKEITPESLMQFPSIEVFINTACPRIALDDASIFRKPILTPIETQVMLGELQWDELCKKGWF